YSTCRYRCFFGKCSNLEPTKLGCFIKAQYSSKEKVKLISKLSNTRLFHFLPIITFVIWPGSIVFLIVANRIQTNVPEKCISKPTECKTANDIKQQMCTKVYA